MTVSPTLTVSGLMVPSSSSLPEPTAMTLPSWGFFLAVSGRKMPPEDFSSPSLGLTTTLSRSGRNAIALPPVGMLPCWICLCRPTARREDVLRSVVPLWRDGQAKVVISAKISALVCRVLKREYSKAGGNVKRRGNLCEKKSMALEEYHPQKK